MKIMLDAGHGGIDSGAVYKSRKESDDTLKIVLEVGRHLKRHNIEVVYTRKKDDTVSLSERCNLQKLNKCDLFVSIHRNAYYSKSQGIETYHYTNSSKGKEIANKIHNEIKGYFVDRGVKTANFQVLRDTSCPSILLEIGFIDNALQTDNKILDAKFADICLSVAKGILEVCNIKFIAESENNTSGTLKKRYSVIAEYYNNKTDAINLENKLKSQGIYCYIVEHNS